MIPLLIAGAIVGLGAHACASVDNDEAIEKNNHANEIIDEANQIAQDAKNLCETSMLILAREKTRVLQGNMNRFIQNYVKIKPINFTDTGDLFEIDKFDKNELAVVQSMVNDIQKSDVNNVVGGVSGTALAVGAADIFAGGSLLGGGLIGGATLGAVAAPIFAVTGLFSASEATANLEKAKSNLEKALVYQDECETYSYLAEAVSERCDLFYETLHKINDTWFTTAVNQLEILVESKKSIRNSLKNVTGKKIYSHQEMQMIAGVTALANMIKTIISTNILDENGQVTDESEQLILEMQDKIENEDLSVKMPESELSLQQVNVQQVSNSYKELQSVSNTSQKVNSAALKRNVKTIYNPNAFVKCIMWLHTIFYVFCGFCIIMGGSFIAGSILMASGLIMCPKVKRTMRFWSRFGLMLLLIVISLLVV